MNFKQNGDKEKMQAKISLISIIYNVAPYLDDCIKSLVRQTYENLEIILVVGEKGDGKDDNCLEIAESYAVKDDRIKIVRCQAMGTGDARNKGLEAASGDYIAFVDGDDYVEEKFIEKLYENLNFHAADIAVCGKYSEYPGRTVADERHAVRDLSGEAACRMILEKNGFFFHCWDKLFKAELFKGLEFPTIGQLEDRYTVGKILTIAESVVYDTTPLYHYRVREDSISKTAVDSEMNTKADEIFCDMVIKRYPSLKGLCEEFLIYDHITCIQNMLLAGIYSKEKAESHRDYVKVHAGEVLKKDGLDRNTRIKIYLTIYCPGLLRLVTRKKS